MLMVLRGLRQVLLAGIGRVLSLHHASQLRLHARQTHPSVLLIVARHHGLAKVVHILLVRWLHRWHAVHLLSEVLLLVRRHLMRD